MQFKVVVFDFDGTLVDTMELYAERASELMEEYYGIPKDRAVKLYWETAGLAFKDQMEVLFPGNQNNVAVVELFEKWKSTIIKDVTLSEEAREVLFRLKTMGLIVAVSSNNIEKYVRDVFKRAETTIDYILGWRGDNFKKGEHHFKYLEEKTKINRNRFLFVGDSLNDLLIAKASRVAFVALEGRFKKKDFERLGCPLHVIKSLKELSEWLNKICYCLTPRLN